MIERNLMQPSRRSETSFWLYSKQDIQTVRTISLLQQLGYSENSIRSILAAPASQWPESLEQQITQLIEKRNHIEDQLFLAMGIWPCAAKTGRTIFGSAPVWPDHREGHPAGGSTCAEVCLAAGLSGMKNCPARQAIQALPHLLSQRRIPVQKASPWSSPIQRIPQLLPSLQSPPKLHNR